MHENHNISCSQNKKDNRVVISKRLSSLKVTRSVSLGKMSILDLKKSRGALLDLSCGWGII